MCNCTQNTGDRMPRFDGTGPRGLGPMTGGGRGFCTGYFPNPYYGYGFLPRYSLPYPRYGYPFMAYPWSGAYQTIPPTMIPSTTSPAVPPSGNPSAPAQTPFGVPFVPTYSKEQERQMLEQQVKMLESQLGALRKRLGELSE